MRGLQVFAALGAVAMAIGIAWGFSTGRGLEELRVLCGLVWGVVSLIDVYVGLGLFAAWIFFREKSTGRALLWTVALIGLGNLAACVYVLIALQQARGDARLLLLGPEHAVAA